MSVTIVQHQPTQVGEVAPTGCEDFWGPLTCKSILDARARQREQAVGFARMELGRHAKVSPYGGIVWIADNEEPVMPVYGNLVPFGEPAKVIAQK
jgi:hypothetical protein